MPEVNTQATLALIELDAAQTETRARRAGREQISTYAIEVLRLKGVFLFATDGRFGGTSGLIGSADPGVMYTQGTPVVVTEPTGAGVALRHKPEERSKAVELIRVPNGDPSSVKDATSREAAIVTFEGSGIDLHDIDNPTEDHFRAVRQLLEGMNDSLPDLVPSLLREVPTVVKYAHEEHPIIDLRAEEIPVRFQAGLLG